MSLRCHPVWHSGSSWPRWSVAIRESKKVTGPLVFERSLCVLVKASAKGRKKMRNMKACLGEAARKLTIQILQLGCFFCLRSGCKSLQLRSKAISVSLIQDVSKGWLCVRYGSASSQLESVSPSSLLIRDDPLCI